MKLAVIGSINMDQVVTTERIPQKGETLHGNDLNYIPGGKGANQAVAMARLGAQVTMFGCVGDDDNGRKLIENLKREQVDTSRVGIVKDTPSGLAVITVAENDNVIVVIPGANAKVDRAYIDSISESLTAYDLVVLQHEIPQDTVQYAIEYCAAHGIPVVLNPAPARALSSSAPASLRSASVFSRLAVFSCRLVSVRVTCRFALSRSFWCWSREVFTTSRLWVCLSFSFWALFLSGKVMVLRFSSTLV